MEVRFHFYYDLAEQYKQCLLNWGQCIFILKSQYIVWILLVLNVLDPGCTKGPIKPPFVCLSVCLSICQFGIFLQNSFLSFFMMVDNWDI